MRKDNFSASLRQKKDLPAPGKPLTTISGGSVWGWGKPLRLCLNFSTSSSKLPAITSQLSPSVSLCVKMLSSLSTLVTFLFLSLRGAIATKQSLSEVPQSNYSRLQLRNEIATSSTPRNDRVGVIVH